MSSSSTRKPNPLFPSLLLASLCMIALPLLAQDAPTPPNTETFTDSVSVVEVEVPVQVLRRGKPVLGLTRRALLCLGARASS